MTSRTLQLLAALAALVPLVAQAQPPAATAAAPAAPVSKTEIAWWLQLQKDLSDLRTANLRAGIRTVPLEATPENLSAIASRLEKFLDQRDRDPVADLGADFKAYRERLVKFVDLALTPVTASAKFKSTLITNGEERMMKALDIRNQVEAIDDYKPQLAKLHDTLNRRVIAGGGESRLFFQVLGVGDKPRAPDALESFEDRDAQFIKDATAIGGVFGDVAKGHFVDTRKSHGLTSGLMEPLILTIEKFRTQFGDTPTDQLQEALKTASSMQEKPGTFNLKRHTLRLDLMRRADPNAYSIAMQEFQGAFQRWLGNVDAIAPVGLCRDVAVAIDGAWFAYAPTETTVVLREAATGKIRATLTTEGSVRALVAATDHRLMIFTTAGLFSTAANASAPKLELRSPLKTAFLEPRLASARTGDRVIFGIGVKPGFAQEGLEHTYSVQKLASRITAVGMSANGMTLFYGYAGDNVTGAGEPVHGIDILSYPGERIELKGSSTESRRIGGPLTAAALAVAPSADGKRVAAAWFGRFGGAVSLDDLSEKETRQTVFTVDGEPYHWVQLIEARPARVIAGTRNGNVRVWNADTRELLATFSVPAGPSGATYALLGEEIISVALGQSGVHRWKIADGSLVASYEGEAAKPDAAAFATRLAAERECLPARETLLEALNAKDNAGRVKAIETLRGAQAKQLDALGQRGMVDYWLARIRSEQIFDLGKAKRSAEGFELGYKEISAGLVEPYLLYITLYAGNMAATSKKPDIRQRTLAIGERAIALFPSDVNIQREYRSARSDAFAETGKIAEALKEVDELDLIDPKDAPHGGRRYDILMYAYDFAIKAGRERDAMQHLISALDYAEDKKDQLMLTTNIFSIAYKLKDWKLAVNAANMVLQVDPNQKNDQQFMAAARYAYSQANPQGKK